MLKLGAAVGIALYVIDTKKNTLSGDSSFMYVVVGKYVCGDNDEILVRNACMYVHKHLYYTPGLTLLLFW